MEDTITQEDLELILKSIQEDLVKAAKEESSSESESESESKEMKKKKEKEKAAKEESSTESSESSESKEMPMKKKSAQDDAVAAPTEDSDPQAQADLYETYQGLKPDELTAHLLAAVLASRTHAGHDMAQAWGAYKSQAEEEVINKSEKETPVVVTAPVDESAAKYVALLESQNKELLAKNTTLEKSIKDNHQEFLSLQEKVEKLSVRPGESQAATTKVVENTEKFVIHSAKDIQKSLSEAAKREDMTAEDRDVIGRYTLRPQMTTELKEFMKKIGSGK